MEKIAFGSIYKGIRFGDVPLPYMIWILDKIQNKTIDITKYPELRSWLDSKRKMILAKRIVFNSNALKNLFFKYEEDYNAK